MLNLVIRSTVASAILDSLVLPIFIFRMWIRIRMRRVGWEDIWAAVAFVCGALNVVSCWVYLIKLSVGQSPMAVILIYMFSFTCLLWAVRISIIFSIIRIIPAKERLHKYGLIIVALFLIICSALIIQRAVHFPYIFQVLQSPLPSLSTRCALLHALNVSELAGGTVADIIAVAFPLYVLRRVSLPPRKLRLLRLLFICSIVVSIICSFHAGCQVAPVLISWGMFITNLQTAACLIVCNLLVVVTYLYRVLGCREHGTTSDTTDEDTTVDDDDRTTPCSPMTLTTIDLLFSTQSGEGVSAATQDGTGLYQTRC